MRAIAQRRYGDPDRVLQVVDLPEPELGPDQVRVQVRAASVHPDIWHAVTGHPCFLRLVGSGLFRPRNPVPGIDLAGVVEAVAEGVQTLRPGDRVFGDLTRGSQWSNAGTFAEVCAVSADALAVMPPGLGFEEAAAVPGSGVIAVQAVHDQGQIEAGHRVLVNGAGGGVGVYAVQLARAAGAEVTAVDHPCKLEMLRAIGAGRVIDYTRQSALRGDVHYDRIIDVASTLPFDKAGAALTPDGLFVLIGHDHYGESAGRWFGSIPRFVRMMMSTPLRGHLPDMNPVQDTSHRIGVRRDRLEAGTLVPVVDRVFPLEQVGDALRHLRSGLALGKVVLRI